MCGVWCVAVVCWWGCGWCVVWLVPRHSWRRFLCTTPRHFWLGFAVGGGGRSSPLLAEGPGCGSPPLLAGVRWRRWCVLCGGGVLVGVWLVCGVVGPSPLLAEVPVCYSPPLLAGFRCRWWLAFLATPGGGSRARFPATPGLVSLLAVVCGVWCVVCGVWCAAVVCWWGCGWCVVWLVPRHSWRRFLCATPRHSWLGFAAGGGVRSSPLLAEGPGRGSPPLLAGVRWRRWCVVCGVWRWCAGGVVAAVWCGWSLATPGGGSCVLLPATSGWVSWSAVVGASPPLLAEGPGCGSPPLLAGVRWRR